MLFKLFDEPADARLFISLIYDATGVLANVQTPSLARVGAMGVIAEESGTFHETSYVKGKTVVGPKQDYVFGSEGVLIQEGERAGSPKELMVDITYQGVAHAAVLVLYEAIERTHRSPPASNSEGLSITTVYECRSFAALLKHGPFRTSVPRPKIMSLHGFRSSEEWKMFQGQELVSPVLKVFTASAEGFRLPWALPDLVPEEIPYATPSPRHLSIELVGFEQLQHDFAAEGDPDYTIPEQSPSPKMRWIELEEINQIEGDFAPEAVPDPPQRWIELVERDDTDAGRIPEMDPHWAELVGETGDEPTPPLVAQPPLVPVSLTLAEGEENNLGESVVENEVELENSTIVEDLSALGIALKVDYDRWEGFEDSDLHSVILAMRDALVYAPDNHPRKPAYVTQLDLALMERFSRFGQVLDIDCVIADQEVLRATMPDKDPRKPKFCTVLANAQFMRFENLGQSIGQSLYLNASVATRRAALDLLPTGYRGRREFLSSLGDALATRFAYSGDTADIVDSVTLHRNALDLTPNGHPRRPACLSGLGAALALQANHFKNVEDLELSFDLQQRAVALTPKDHPEASKYLFNLSKALVMRFERLHNTDDIDTAIYAGKKSLSLARKGVRIGHLSASRYHSHMSNCKALRFDHLGDATDILAAMSEMRKAIESIPDGHPAKPKLLSGAADLSIKWFEHPNGHYITDLMDATRARRMSVKLIPDGDPDKAKYLSSLAGTLAMEFEHRESDSALHECIRARRMALDLTPDGHPDKPKYFSDLADSLNVRFERLGDVSDLEASTSARQKAGEITQDDKPKHKSSVGNVMKTKLRDMIGWNRGSNPAQGEGK